jgi:hypothetical protein
MTPDGRRTTLRNGPTLPTALVELALDLEARGLRLERNGMNLRLVPSGSQPLTLSEAETATLRRGKGDLLALVDYCDSGAATAPERT